MAAVGAACTPAGAQCATRRPGRSQVGGVDLLSFYNRHIATDHQYRGDLVYNYIIYDNSNILE